MLCWHMHQPEYRDPADGTWREPWTHLHAIKDYVDMVAHLEAHPQARAVVNFVPILLEQIEACSGEIDAWRGGGPAPRDPLLRLLADSRVPDDGDARKDLAGKCLRANRQRMIERFAPYRELYAVAAAADSAAAAWRYLDESFFLDLAVWYHIAWLGETVRRDRPLAQRLMRRARRFGEADRHALLALIGELLGSVIDRYRRLADDGRIELSVSPHAHPMLPLLIDFASARDALPDAVLPDGRYPDGEARARWQVDRGLAVFERFFGRRPRGCWPSEGGVSDAVVTILEEAGFDWFASGQGVLGNSLRRSACRLHGAWPYRPYRIDGRRVRGFFRDDGLSDAIGFHYSGWHADDAVGDFIHRLERIAAATGDPGRHVVAVILDGENAWEHYPDNGYWFLDILYRRLAEHGGLNLTTFSECLQRFAGDGDGLPAMCAGSWVYGTFSTWIGQAGKNRAWDELCAVKREVDRRLPALDADLRRRVLDQLAVCEGSDWFWWFGDDNPARSVEEFARLFRTHLGFLYRLIGAEPPDSLGQTFGGGAGQEVEAGGVMRRGGTG